MQFPRTTNAITREIHRVELFKTCTVQCIPRHWQILKERAILFSLAPLKAEPSRAERERIGNNFFLTERQHNSIAVKARVGCALDASFNRPHRQLKHWAWGVGTSFRSCSHSTTTECFYPFRLQQALQPMPFKSLQNTHGLDFVRPK